MALKQRKRDRVHPPILTYSVRRYLDATIRPSEGVLRQLEADAVKNDVPISGPLIGSTLSILARLCNAKNILEIGTATGYSAIWLARAMGSKSGQLTTIEMDPERQNVARRSLKRAGVDNQHVKMILGDAKKVVPQIAGSSPEKFDMVFMDVGDKSLYSELLDDCIRALRPGGLLIFDDTLYRGVAVSSVKTRKPVTMRNFNARVASDKRLDSVILPIGDGLTIAVKS